MFKEIEGRLEGSWDLYIKALEQYKEREGDCLVSSRHIEVVDGVSVKLGQWCQTMRVAKEGKGSWKFTKEMKEQLDKKGFIWDVYRYRFENNIKFIAEYYEKHEEYPSQHSENLEVKKVGGILCYEKIKMRNEKEVYPEWKMKIIRKYLPDFSYENRLEKSVCEFIYYAKLYKKRFGHTNIKKRVN